MKDNLEILQLGWDVPQEARKPISGGRLNGKTDISPMWRIQKLTEIFGPCGLGWWYVITDQRLEDGADGEVKAFVDIDLYYRWGEQVSQPIPGVGGNTFVERGEKYTSDECFKMALTDAISVAAKALGIGGSVYCGGGDRTKYDQRPQRPQRRTEEQAPPPASPDPPVAPEPAQQPQEPFLTCECCGKRITPFFDAKGRRVNLRAYAEKSTQTFGKVLCLNCMPT